MRLLLIQHPAAVMMAVDYNIVHNIVETIDYKHLFALESVVVHNNEHNKQQQLLLHHWVLYHFLLPLLEELLLLLVGLGILHSCIEHRLGTDHSHIVRSTVNNHIVEIAARKNYIGTRQNT
jgi:hypothetical protein